MLHKAFASLLVLALLAAPAFAAGAPAAADDDAPSWSASLHGFFIQALDLLGLSNADSSEYGLSPEPGGSTVTDEEGANEFGASPQPGGATNEFGLSPEPSGVTESDDDPSSEWGASPEPNG